MLPPLGAMHWSIRHHTVQHRRLGCLNEVIIIQLSTSEDETKPSL